MKDGMLRVSHPALLLVLATITATSRATSADAPPPPAPAFRPVLYRPWVPGESVPGPRETLHEPPAQLVPGPEYARRPYLAGVSIAMLPFECLASRQACGPSAQSASLAWRSYPHFAWTLAGERTDLASGDRHYFALGARVFAHERGVLDPFLELNLGGEVSAKAGGIALAGEVVFGLGVYLIEHFMLAPTLEFRHSEHRVGVCRSSLAACDPWLRERTYSVALGLGVSAVWGPAK